RRGAVDHVYGVVQRIVVEGVGAACDIRKHIHVRRHARHAQVVNKHVRSSVSDHELLQIRNDKCSVGIATAWIGECGNHAIADCIDRGDSLVYPIRNVHDARSWIIPEYIETGLVRSAGRPVWNWDALEIDEIASGGGLAGSRSYKDEAESQ